MENVLNGLYNFLNFIHDNWGMIAAIIMLTVAICKKIANFFGKSREEQLAIAKTQISETMLKWVSLAECDWLEWQQAGEIKRSQVIDMIFEKYPVLSKVTNQAEIIAWLDDTINEALKKMRKIFEENTKKEMVEEIVEIAVEAETTIEG